jgi:EAL domain-containing protein (putative c-di-GMP-specific phosphodiesterase class I)
VGSGPPDYVNLPAAASLRAPGRQETGIAQIKRARLAPTILLVAVVVTAISAFLEFANPGNHWLLFEDISSVVAPGAGALVVLIAATRSEPEHRVFRWVLALMLGITASGQLIAVIPDVIPSASVTLLRVVSESGNVFAAMAGIVVLWLTVYRRLEGERRQQAFLDGLIIMAASMTFIVADWLLRSLAPGAQAGAVFSDPVPNLIVPLVSAMFVSTAITTAVCALALRVEPGLRGVWAVVVGVVLIDLAWNGWFARILSGAPDGIELMDFIFPAGALLVAYGGLTWTLRPGGGPRYSRVARAISDWLPIAAIVGCVFLDVMPRRRPLEVDPIVIGTGLVVLLAVIRLRLLQGSARMASERLTTEMQERAATTAAMALLESMETVEGTAERICAGALLIDGIDTVAVFGFTQDGVVPLAQAGPETRPVAVGEPMPVDSALELREHADFGLWIESWADRKPRDDFDRAVIASGLRAEAVAPLVWDDRTIGLLSMGAVSPAHARRLGDRLATLTEFSVMSAAVLGPMLSRRWERERLQNIVEATISSRAFHPVFQPVVDLATGKFVGYEALTRFDDGTRPDLAFLAADKVGMMVKLELATLREQVRQARRLPKGAWVSLNVSPALAVALIPLLDVLAEADRDVVLEVTEHAEIEDYPRLMAALGQVRHRARLAVDDAGAGYAGLRHILELKPQFVKLDISLVRNVDNDPARQAMVIGMAHFATSVGCDLIAEGIETANELTALRLLGVAFGQGYLLGRPATIEVAASGPTGYGGSDSGSGGAESDGAVVRAVRTPRSASGGTVPVAHNDRAAAAAPDRSRHSATRSRTRGARS